MPGFTSSAWQAYVSRLYAAPCVVEGSSWGVAPFFPLVAAPAISSFHPWPVPALTTALILVVALTLTFTKGLWRSQGTPPKELTLLEILPVAENLEFFEAMEILDAMDLLEAVEGAKNGSA